MNTISQQTDVVVITKKIPQTNLFDANSAEFTAFCTCLYYHIQHSPHRVEIARHLAQAAAYIESGISQKYKTPLEFRKTRQDSIFGQFIDYVRQYHTKERSINFYADKLCLTPKYLSSVIKNYTGKVAHDWINEFVIEKAKALLKSSNLTIQQISDELNFPNQSFFGTYFKRHVGLCPKEYIKMAAL